MEVGLRLLPISEAIVSSSFGREHMWVVKMQAVHEAEKS
jgi:hypothetical protein